MLPLVSAAAARQANVKRSSGVFFAEPLTQRILVIDDDLGLREMISTALGMRGAEVVAVDRAEAALVQKEPFAVAIVDLLLPGMRGDALLARLREARLVEIGMLMTGTELPNALAAGGRPDVLLRKPFELEELFEGSQPRSTPNAVRGAAWLARLTRPISPKRRVSCLVDVVVDGALPLPRARDQGSTTTTTRHEHDMEIMGESSTTAYDDDPSIHPLRAHKRMITAIFLLNERPVLLG